MWKRFINLIKAFFNKFMTSVEDPEMMLDQARRDMQEVLSRNRERAVEALAAKNRLEMTVREVEVNASNCEQKAALALKQGNRELALTFMAEKRRWEANLESLRASLATANNTVEQVKQAIKHQEGEVRKKTAEALALKAQWKTAQIQNSITKALEGLTFENELEGFGAAEAKIKDAQSEAAARQEMFGESIAGKVMQLEQSAVDTDAESDLRALEERLGIATPIAITAGSNTSTVEDQLSELEARIATK